MHVKILYLIYNIFRTREISITSSKNGNEPGSEDVINIRSIEKSIAILSHAKREIHPLYSKAVVIHYL